MATHKKSVRTHARKIVFGLHSNSNLGDCVVPVLKAFLLFYIHQLRTSYSPPLTPIPHFYSIDNEEKVGRNR